MDNQPNTQNQLKMDNQPNTNDEPFTPQIVCKTRRSIFEPDIPSPTTLKTSNECYKRKLEKEIKDWTKALQEKYIRTKKPPPQLQESSEDETNVKLTEAQMIYLSQAPDFRQMIDDRKEFVKSIEYYLSLRSHVAEDIEYRHELLNSISNKAIRDIIFKAIYE